MGKKENKDKKENKIIELQKQVTENLAGWQRAKADYENLQKQSAQEKAQLIKFANANILIELLPVMNNFEMAFNSVPKEQQDSPWVIGLQHIKNQLETFLQNNGVEKIKTVNEKFDPNLHEAMVDEQCDEKKAEGIILKEIKAGYKLHDKVIQVAKVVVNQKEKDANAK